MKLGGEWAKRTSHKVHILSSRLILFSINHIHIQITSLNQTYTTDFSNYFWFRSFSIQTTYEICFGEAYFEYFETCDFPAKILI
jgi:hypothetical protein